jgi:hypothetical protein
MTFKLTEKDIEAIEVIVSDYASGMQADKVSDKNNVGNATMIRSFLSVLRGIGVDAPKHKCGVRAGSESAKQIGEANRKHWARFRELEAREDVR